MSKVVIKNSYIVWDDRLRVDDRNYFDDCEKVGYHIPHDLYCYGMRHGWSLFPMSPKWFANPNDTRKYFRCCLIYNHLHTIRFNYGIGMWKYYFAQMALKRILYRRIELSYFSQTKQFIIPNEHLLLDFLPVNITENTYLDLFSKLDGFDMERKGFDKYKCAIWTEDVIRYGYYSKPSFQCNLVHDLLESFYLRSFKRYFACHTCPEITGEFNSGLCVNPLHIKFGNYSINRRDMFVHKVIKSIIRPCFKEYIYCDICIKNKSRKGLLLTKKEKNMICNLCERIHVDPPDFSICRCQNDTSPNLVEDDIMYIDLDDVPKFEFK